MSFYKCSRMAIGAFLVAVVCLSRQQVAALVAQKWYHVNLFHSVPDLTEAPLAKTVSTKGTPTSAWIVEPYCQWGSAIVSLLATQATNNPQTFLYFVDCEQNIQRLNTVVNVPHNPTVFAKRGFGEQHVGTDGQIRRLLVRDLDGDRAQDLLALVDRNRPDANPVLAVFSLDPNRYLRAVSRPDIRGRQAVALLCLPNWFGPSRSAVALYETGEIVEFHMIEVRNQPFQTEGLGWNLAGKIDGQCQQMAVANTDRDRWAELVISMGSTGAPAVVRVFEQTRQGPSPLEPSNDEIRLWSGVWKIRYELREMGDFTRATFVPLFDTGDLVVFWAGALPEQPCRTVRYHFNDDGRVERTLLYEDANDANWPKPDQVVRIKSSAETPEEILFGSQSGAISHLVLNPIGRPHCVFQADKPIGPVTIAESFKATNKPVYFASEKSIFRIRRNATDVSP